MATATVIGIAGLGLVGSALALRLGRAGYAVLGFDVDPARAAVLEETHPGAARADLAALARDGDCLVIAASTSRRRPSLTRISRRRRWT